MKVSLRNTDKIVMFIINGVEVPARIWEGHTANGVPCHAYITRFAGSDIDDLTEFEKDLAKVSPPSAVVAAIPSRMIL